MWWLKTIEMYSPTAWSPKVQNQGIVKVVLPPKSLREIMSFTSFRSW